MKIAIVSCYDQIDYVRTRVLRTAFAAAPGVQAIIVKNTRKGLARYLETPLKILRCAVIDRPDAYVLTFRGYEMLPFLLLVKGRKPLIFDEMINAAEYLQEHNTVQLESAIGKLFRKWYGSLLRRCRFVLADTDAHAAYSAKICNVPLEKFRTIPVSADENLFCPDPSDAHQKGGNTWHVFYYGSMVPLHGLQYALDAAVLLKDKPEIRFTVVGGREKAEQACVAAAAQGAHVTYQKWLPFEQIPERARHAGLCLGGPFGDTLQAQFVITGKTAQFLACAAPVLVGRNKVSDLFIDKQNCLSVPLVNPAAIAEAIAWAHEHPTELAQIATNGRKLYERHFSQNVVNRAAVQIVEELR